MFIAGYLFTTETATGFRALTNAVSTGRVRRHCRAWLPAVWLVAMITMLLASLFAHNSLRDALASRPTVGAPAVPADAGPIAITVTAGNSQAPLTTTVAELKTSPAAWKRMHVADWNEVPAEIREASFRTMLQRYASELRQPETWDRMTADDWDDIPHPVRVAAFRRMTAYWVGFYKLAHNHELKPWLVSEVAQAIVMSESWFDHRAVVRDASGNRDIGLGQASTFARVRIRHLYAAGAVDFTLSDAEYLDPWMATRFVATWLGLLLDESRGNLELAVRAYNRGIAKALDVKGDAYFATVTQRRQRYIRGVGAPPAWQTLAQMLRAEPIARVASR